MFLTPEETAVLPDGVTIDNDSGELVENKLQPKLPERALPISQLEPDRQFSVLRSQFLADSDHSAEWRKDCTFWMAFRAGEQWTVDDMALLDSQQRPHIVFNRVLTILKAVAGMEINGRHEISFIPRNNEDTKPNELLSAASKWMADTCDGEDEESTAFDNTATCGMGWVEERISYEDDPAGLYVEESVDPREMRWDRSAKKKNLKDSRRMFRARRMSLGDASMIFPGFDRAQLDAGWAQDGMSDAPMRSIEERRRRDGDTYDPLYDDECEVTIVHAQWIEHETYWIVADEVENQQVELTDDEYQALVARAPHIGLEIVGARHVRKVFKQAFLGSEMLEPAGDAPIKGQFSWKCITGEFDAKRRTWFGLVKVMRDPQMWANKWLSQILHILNTTAKGGIIAETDAFDDQDQAEESYAQPEGITWAATGALSGQAGPKIMPKPGAGSIEGYVGLLAFAISSVKDVTGINLELLGQQDQNQPGILEAMRKQAGMTVLATLFDALRNFRKQVGRTRLYFIQTFLSDNRLIRVTGMNDVQAIRLAKDKTTGAYDVIVDDTPTSPNQKEQNWAIIQPMLAIFKDQLVSNPEIFALLLEYSPLPSRIVEAIKTMIQQQQNDPKTQQETMENRKLLVDKTLAEIAKDQSTAELNNAKAGSSQAVAMYDLAMARNLLEDNKMAGLKAHLEAMEARAKAQDAEARSAKTAAEIDHINAKTTRERSGAVADVMDAHDRREQSAHDRAKERAGMVIDAVANVPVAHSTVERNMAMAEKARADARRPNPKPAGAR